MATKRNIWELSAKERLDALSSIAKEGIEKSHAAGLPTRHLDKDNNLYELYPDGSKKYILEAESDVECLHRA